MTTAAKAPTVDVNVPRFNQGLVAVLTGLAFVLDAPALVVVTFAILAVSWAWGPRLAPFTRLYVDVIRPRIQPEGPREVEPAAPPRFAQLVGAVFLGGASLAFALGAPVAGWVLTLVVTALAALAATTRICVGCIIYEKVVAR